MKKIWPVVFLFFFFSGVYGRTLILDDFSSGKAVNSLGLKTEVWYGDPQDETQGLTVTFARDVPSVFGIEKGKSLRLEYDVDSPNPAYNGYLSKLGGIDFTRFNQLVFFVRADPVQGCTSCFVIELKSPTEKGKFLVTGVSRAWKKISIPLAEFSGITDWKKIEELVIVFADGDVDKKTGALIVGTIFVTDGKSDEKTGKPVRTRSKK